MLKKNCYSYHLCKKLNCPMINVLKFSLWHSKSLRSKNIQGWILRFWTQNFLSFRQFIFKKSRTERRHGEPIKWPCARNTGRSGSGKNQKSWFFLLGLKYTLRTCFESKKFLSKSCPELSNQVLSFSEGQIYLINWVRLPDNFFNFLTSGGQVWIY